MEFIPFPFNVVKDDDLYTVVDCVADSVFDLAKDWTQEVVTTFTNIIGEHGDLSSLDFSPLLNTKSVENELNDTYTCLFNLANDIQDRHEDNNDVNIWSEATDYFEFHNLTLTIEISFSACTVTCGTAALGFAVSTTDFGLARPYYTIAMGVDSSSVVGASIGAALGFYKNFSVIPGSDHLVSFGASIPLPLLPDIGLPDVKVKISADEGSEGEFSGFSLESDIIDFEVLFHSDSSLPTYIILCVCLIYNICSLD